MAKSTRIVQVCLVMDCTASMQPWIDAAVKTLTRCLNNVKVMYPTDTIQVAFVGYRDIQDKQQFIIESFTEDYYRVVDTIRGVNAFGGYDLAEDVAGAYSVVNNLKWNADVKVIFHVCDAPNHGLEYHQKWYDDSFPQGVGAPPLENTVIELAKQEVDITFLRLNYTTDIMVDIMEDAYHTVRSTGFSEIPVSDQDYMNPTQALETSLNNALISSLSMDSRN